MSTAQEQLKKRALTKVARYCALGERSLRQVKDKLAKERLSETEIAQIIDELREGSFLDERRFAAAFCNDKLRFNSWGKNRLRMELKGHQISLETINRALEELDIQLYQEQLKNVLSKKLFTLKDETEPLMKKKKLAEHAIRKGFEADLVFKLSEQLLSSVRH